MRYHERGAVIINQKSRLPRVHMLTFRLELAVLSCQLPQDSNYCSFVLALLDLSSTPYFCRPNFSLSKKRF